MPRARCALCEGRGEVVDYSDPPSPEVVHDGRAEVEEYDRRMASLREAEAREAQELARIVAGPGGNPDVYADAATRALDLLSRWKRAYGRHALYSLPFACDRVSARFELDPARVRTVAREILSNRAARRKR